MRTLEEMVKDRLSTWEISKELGLSQTAVRARLKKVGLKTNPMFNPSIKTLIIGEKKICPKCKQSLEVNRENFYICKNKIHSWCKKCNNKVSHDRQLAQKQRAIEYKGGKCYVCGYNKYYGALEFHHLNPDTKEFSISELRTYTWNRLKIELDKCMLLCRNCHAEIHAKNVGLPGFEPGTKAL